MGIEQVWNLHYTISCLMMTSWFPLATDRASCRLHNNIIMTMSETESGSKSEGRCSHTHTHTHTCMHMTRTHAFMHTRTHTCARTNSLSLSHLIKIIIIIMLWKKWCTCNSLSLAGGMGAIWLYITTRDCDLPEWWFCWALWFMNYAFYCCSWITLVIAVMI